MRTTTLSFGAIFLTVMIAQSTKAFSKTTTTRKPVIVTTTTKKPVVTTTTTTTTTLPRTVQIQPGADLEIARGQTFVLSQSLDLGKLTINGTLRCDPNLRGELKANVIYVNGLFECGSSSSSRFQGDLKIGLKHSSETAEAYRGMVVRSGGVLRFHGLDNKSGFVKLDGTVNPGNNQIVLSENRNWSVGDKIVVSSTSYEPDESEEFSIVNIAGRSVTLNRAFLYRHHGQEAFYSTQTGRKSLDERAEIANLTRNILIYSYGTVGGEKGGHVMVHRGGQAFIDSVEFDGLGQAGEMGRYPFHWHIVGNVNGQYIRNSSIHHSTQRCVVIHDTNRASVENNVCFNFKGHGFMLEDGTEKDNILDKNLAIFAQFPSPGKVLRASENPDPEINKELDRFPTVSSYWISHPQNTVTNNVASGSVGSGFWNSFDGRNRGLATTTFSNNIAHGALVGHTWDGAEKIERNSLEMTHYQPRTIQRFTGIQAFKNKRVGIYFRGGTADFDNAILEGNGRSLFLAFNQRVKNSLVVGEYKGNSCSRGAPVQFLGVVLYDGPWQLDTVDFWEFHHSDNHIPIKSVGGVDKWINYSKRLSFNQDPGSLRRVVHRDFTTKVVEDLWMDYVFANGIRDLDGSLSGSSEERVLLPAAQITRHPGCVDLPSLRGMVSCPKSTRVFVVRAYLIESYLDPKEKKPHPFKVIYDLTRNDGKSAAMDLPTDWKTRVLEKIDETPPFFTKTILISDPTHLKNPVYTFTFPEKAKKVELRITSEFLGEETPKIVIQRAGSTKYCEGQVNGKVKTSSRENTALISWPNTGLSIGKGSLPCNW